MPKNNFIVEKRKLTMSKPHAAKHRNSENSYHIFLRNNHRITNTYQM